MQDAREASWVSLSPIVLTKGLQVLISCTCDMDHISHLFNVGAQCLKESVIAFLEWNYADLTVSQVLKLQRKHNVNVTLDICRLG